MVAAAGDFDSVFAQLGSVAQTSDGVSLKRKAPEEGQRENLRVYETMPSQMLNAYGMAAFSKMNQEKIWEEFNKPLKTGEVYDRTLQCRGGAQRRRYQPLPSSPRGVCEIPEDGGYDEAEPVHPEGRDLHAAV